MSFTFKLVVAFLLTLFLISPATVLAQKGKSPGRKPPAPTGTISEELIYGLTSTNSLLSFVSSAPGLILSSVPITGLQVSELVLGIDFRPATRELYALGSTSRLYRINRVTGAATEIATFVPTLNGTAFGFDFNPVMDRIRVASDANQNLRLDPNTGNPVITEGTLSYPGGDPNAGTDPNIVGSAYTNNFQGATSTTLYDIDSNLDILVTQDPGNGLLHTVGALGFNTSDLVGFDVSRASTTAFASLTAPAASLSTLFSINLVSGTASTMGEIGGGATIRDVALAPADLIISEFRLRGPDGPSDEFVEIYNPSPVSLTVASFDGSAGFSLAASDGVIRFTIPSGTVIAPGGHYLAVNSVGYSLAGYPAGNGTTATGDATYSTEIGDDVGIALFATANSANFTRANLLDAVGQDSEPNSLYREFPGYGNIGASASEYTLVRKLKSGVPQDLNANVLDFIYADTVATATSAGQHLGAPGPENSSSPIQRNATIKASLVAPCILSTMPPNRVRTGSGNSGTLEIRRKFKNNTGASVTRLRFRIVDVTTLQEPGGVAYLIAVTSTSSNESQPCGGGTIALGGLTLESPSAPALGGGFNSSVSANSVSLATPLGPGASIDVNFLLNVVQAGSFRFFVNVEALP